MTKKKKTKQKTNLLKRKHIQDLHRPEVTVLNDDANTIIELLWKCLIKQNTPEYIHLYWWDIRNKMIFFSYFQNSNKTILKLKHSTMKWSLLSWFQWMAKANSSRIWSQERYRSDPTISGTYGPPCKQENWAHNRPSPQKPSHLLQWLPDRLHG